MGSWFSNIHIRKNETATEQAIGKQLNYLKRDLKAIEGKLLLGQVLTGRQMERLNIVKSEAAREDFMKSSNRDDGWLTGRLYFNKEDKRVIIKRPRSGFGYTMNLGNKWTWIFSIMVVIMIVIFVSVL